MKALHTIIAFCIASSLSLHAMKNNKKYMGLSMYHPNYHSDSDYYLDGSSIYYYCTKDDNKWRKPNTERTNNCNIINAYLLLNRRPQESVEQQIKFYEQELETTTKELGLIPGTFTLDPATDILGKDKLRKRQLFLQTLIPQIQRANLSGKPQDNNLKEKVGNALNNMSAYNQWELDGLDNAVKRANHCNALDNNK